MASPRTDHRKDAAHKRAVEMLKRAPLIDGHNDLAWVLRESGRDLADYDLARPHPETDTDLPRLKSGMVATQVLAAYLPSDIANPATVTLEQIDLIRRIEALHADVLMPIRRSADILAAKRKGRIGVLISVEGTVGCEGSLAPLRAWRELGVRLVTLCHNGSLPWIDSATDAPKAGGLSAFGAAIVAELNRLGVIVDLSHASVEAALAAVEASRAPVVLSHSNAHALCPHPRNAPDDLIRAVAKAGGVVMATFVPEFINPALWACVEPAKRARWAGGGAEAHDAHIAGVMANGGMPEATLDGFCDHVEHLLKLVGPDHVGIGSDFFGGEQPRGLEDVSAFPALFAALIRRGHGEQVLSRIAGANFLRVMRKVERIGRQMEAEAVSHAKPKPRRKPGALKRTPLRLTAAAAARRA
jgi:membrane dipeptidase